jgi:4-amino-4-deoxy-L-arabinose transferase-like glycosyltransferase
MTEAIITMDAKKNTKLIIWFLVVIAVAVALRVVLFVYYPSVSYSDTASYRRSADAILGGFKAYDGTRTPGYPAFMALIGPDRAVYAAQLLLGLGITLAWFWIGWKASGQPFFAALAALAHTLNPGQFFFEANLLTETLATFWLAAALLGACLWLKSPQRRNLWEALGIGLSSALAALTRPLFIFMPVVLAVFMAFSLKRKRLAFDWKPLLGVLLPALLLIGGWMSWVWSNYHVFSMSTMTGYHLVQHTGYYFEDVPDEYAAIREVYLDYREVRIAERGTQGNAIWDAIPALQNATGMNFYELSRNLQKISIQLILTHPGEYLSRAVRGWWFFWRAPVYWDQAAFSSPGLVPWVSKLVWGARGMIFFANIVFLVTSLAGLLSKRLRQVWALDSFMWLLAASVWATSVVSSLLDHGDNPRFLVPLQTAVIFWALWIALSTWRAIMNKRNESARKSTVPDELE